MIILGQASIKSIELTLADGVIPLFIPWVNNNNNQLITYVHTCK